MTCGGCCLPDSLRVHVYRDRDLAQGAVADGRRDGVADGLDGIVAALGLDQQAATVAPSKPEQGRRAEQVVSGREPIGDQPVYGIGRALDPLVVLAGERDLDQMREGRVAEGTAPLQLARQE